ncbi:MAG: Bax inhibitor-1/YccA family protein [Acidobacteria bacterium]|nr:Bax inhibitor-1/YccA family protein [Acidobacteriota bacterium]MBV9476768.1 Bax inhibitor-1/YccA family protein [Acidobacteriota bacterium]
MSDYRYQPQPAQPAWIDASTAQTVERERSFVRSVYAWMFAGLAITAGASLWVVLSEGMQQLIFGNRAMPWVLMLVELGLVFYLSARITRMSAAAAASAFLVFSLLNGLSLSVIFFAYTAQSIFQAFAVAAGMFGAMSVYGTVTKRDLTSWGSFFFMGLIGILICSVVNIFLKSPAFAWAISLIGVFVFLGLTAYDTQKLKAYATAPQLRENLAVYGALALYLDFINLFLFLLRLFGGGSSRR